MYCQLHDSFTLAKHFLKQLPTQYTVKVTFAMTVYAILDMRHAYHALRIARVVHSLAWVFGALQDYQ